MRWKFVNTGTCSANFQVQNRTLVVQKMFLLSIRPQTKTCQLTFTASDSSFATKSDHVEE